MFKKKNMIWGLKNPQTHKNTKMRVNSFSCTNLENSNRLDNYVRNHTCRK